MKNRKTYMALLLVALLAGAGLLGVSSFTGNTVNLDDAVIEGGYRYFPLSDLLVTDENALGMIPSRGDRIVSERHGFRMRVRQCVIEDGRMYVYGNRPSGLITHPDKKNNKKIMKRSTIYTKHWPKKNLGEVAAFLERIYPEGLSGRVLAADLQQTPQSISEIFKKDDMRLSKAEKIARRYGYVLNIYYPLRQQFDWFTPPPPKQEFPKAGNLAGLVQYINDAGWSVTHAAHRMGQLPNVLFRAFSKGDIKISTLNKMLDNIGIMAIWKFTPEENIETVN